MSLGSRSDGFDPTANDWRDGHDETVLPADVRRAFPALAGPFALRRLSGGLLHASHHVRTPDAEYVLQRVSDVFAPDIHANIEAVTAHLAARGCPTPRLLRTIDGALSVALGSLGRWRLMTHLGGTSFTTVQSIEQARSAGRLVGRFQVAMRGFDRPLAPMGIPYRDTPVYLATLANALERHADHRLAASMRPLAQRVFEAFDALGPPPAVPHRVIHGDLKLQNVLFESREPPGRDRAFALIDLDTLMWAPLWVELGDAWRSWCNPAGEDGAQTRFDLSIFEASLRGFLETEATELSPEERDSLASAPERLTLELCARYVSDAFEESYFGWNESAYPGRGEHNAARALGQWRCFEAACATRTERAALLRSLG